jgi:hypothetical protein
MSQYVESMLPSMGLATDAAGNIVPVPEPGAKTAAAPPPTPTPAPAAAPAAPTKATTTQANIPEPPQTGQASPDEAVLKKKTLLGG